MDGRRYTREQVEDCKSQLADFGLSSERDIDSGIALGFLVAKYGKGAV